MNYFIEQQQSEMFVAEVNAQEVRLQQQQQRTSKTRQCRKCKQPMKGHSKTNCSASDALPPLE